MARVILAAAVAAILLFPSTAHAGRGMFVGVDDDTLKWVTRPDRVVRIDRDLGIGTIRITVPWHQGEARLSRLALTYITRAARATKLGERIVIAVYGPASQAPVGAAARSQYCGFLRHVVAVFPKTAGVVVWNEANSPHWWPARAGASAYEALLARCWDVLHRGRHHVNVIDSTGTQYDPAAFIGALGAAYRRSGRDRPIMDTFGHNPYPKSASELPSATHPAGMIGEGDYARLVQALREAFLFTAQPLPTEHRPTLWYLEDGFQTAVPRWLRSVYTGHETVRDVIPPVAFAEPNQADQLRAAVELAYCQPGVGAFFNFELFDEHRLAGWQSGLLYTDGVPKPSYLPFRMTLADVARGRIDCGAVAGVPTSSLPLHSP